MSTGASPATSPWVRVVVVAYNAQTWLQRVIDGLARQTDSAFEAVIVDNASTDGSVAALRLPDRRFRVLEAGANLGFAAGCNLGAKGAATPFLAMLNPDAVPDPGWLAALREATRRYPATAMFGSTQLAADDPGRLDGAGDLYSACGIAWRGGFGASTELAGGDRAPFSPCAAAALYRREAYETAGGFAEGFFCYLEDVELGFRLRLAGHSAVQVAAAQVLHAGSAVTGRHSPFTLYHSTRNGIFTLVRCMPLPLLPICLPLYVLAQLWLCRRVPSSGNSRLQGLRDGLRALPDLWEQRGDIQRKRRLSTLAVARLLVWNPRALNRRAMPPEIHQTQVHGRP